MANCSKVIICKTLCYFSVPPFIMPCNSPSMWVSTTHLFADNTQSYQHYCHHDTARNMENKPLSIYKWMKAKLDWRVHTISMQFTTTSQHIWVLGVVFYAISVLTNLPPAWVKLSYLMPIHFKHIEPSLTQHCAETVMNSLLVDYCNSFTVAIKHAQLANRFKSSTAVSCSHYLLTLHLHSTANHMLVTVGQPSPLPLPAH